MGKFVCTDQERADKMEIENKEEKTTITLDELKALLVQQQHVNELQRQQIEELNNILLGDKENHDETKVDDKENHDETKIDDKENHDETEPVSTF